MKTRTTLILVILAAGFYSFVRFYLDKKWTSTREAREKSEHVVNFDRDKIDGITIASNESAIELRKRGDDWFIDAPVKDAADASAVTQLLTSVEMLRPENTIPESEKGAKDRLKDFGLAKA